MSSLPIDTATPRTFPNTGVPCSSSPPSGRRVSARGATAKRVGCRGKDLSASESLGDDGRDAAVPRTAPSDCHTDIKHEKGGFTMRPRTLLLFALAGLMGAAVAVLPALAAGPSAPSEVKLEVAEHCYFAKWPCWNVKGNNPADIRDIQPFTIAQGGTISFEDNEASYPTDVIWKGTPPSCTPKVPSTPETNWSGTCTFANA